MSTYMINYLERPLRELFKLAANEYISDSDDLIKDAFSTKQR